MILIFFYVKMYIINVLLNNEQILGHFSARDVII